MPADVSQLQVSTRGRRRGKLRLLTRANLDSRTRAAKRFDAIAQGIVRDLVGGDESRLSTIQKHLIEAFAGAALHVQDLNARLLLGGEVDLAAHSQIVSTLVRVASRLPNGRVASAVPTLDQYLARRQYSEAAE
jgi:hypothetical protein